MGRITPSFRQLFHKYIKQLRKRTGFQPSLLNREHKEAFDLLLKEAWSVEHAAMSNAGISCIMDILNLMANVHNKKCIDELRLKLEEIERHIVNRTAR